MKSRFNHTNAHLNLRWKLELDRPVISENCEERNWTRVEDDEMDFHFYWASA